MNQLLFKLFNNLGKKILKLYFNLHVIIFLVITVLSYNTEQHINRS